MSPELAAPAIPAADGAPEVAPEGPIFDWPKDAPDGPKQAVFVAMGAMSACWENLAGAGVFKSTRAKQIGDELMEYLYAHGLPRG